MKIVVLASRPVTAEQLRDALPGDVDPTQGEVTIVAPAVQQSAMRFWLSDADEAIARADKVREETEQQLGDAGVSTRSETGESDPMTAIEDALNTFNADRIVLFGSGADDGYREDPTPTRCASASACRSTWFRPAEARASSRSAAAPGPARWPARTPPSRC